MLYTNETWSGIEEDVIRPERNDARMVRWMCSVKPEDKIFEDELRTRLKLKEYEGVLVFAGLYWFGHLERMKESPWSSKYRAVKISGSLPRG